MKRVSFILLISIIVFSACQRELKNDKLFTFLLSDHTNITFTNNLTEDEKNNILTYEYFYNGGGVAIGDINNDGLPDIYFSSNQESNKLYLNKGDFKFEDITEIAGISAKSGWKTGVVMVDVNADGFLDIYVCRSGDLHEFYRSNALYINNGDLTFTDKASEYGLNDKSYSTACAFFDYDRDGDLDLFLLNHSRLYISNSYDIDRRYDNERVRFVGNRLYRNDGGKYIDVSDEMGIYGPVSNYGLGVAIGDINKDGWPDIYTSNDYTEKDKLFLNEKGAFFHEVSDSLLTHMSLSSMGAAVADLNNDALLDIVSLDMLSEANDRQKEFFWQYKYDLYQSMLEHGLHRQHMRNMVHINNGNGAFREIGEFLGVSNTDWSWSPLIADYDNDGFQDLFITNGFKKNFTSNDFLNSQADEVRKIKMRQSSEKLIGLLELLPDNEEHDYMFRNQGNTKFSNVTEEWGFNHKTLSNGTAYGDLDNDGDLDIVVNCVDGKALIYENNAEKFENNYLKVILKGDRFNPQGVGSEIAIYSQGNKLFRSFNPFTGYQSSVEPAVFFGLGKRLAIDSLIIKWPDGLAQTLLDIEINQTLTLDYANASDENTVKPEQSNTYFEASGTIDYIHSENNFVDFDKQPLLPRMYSTMGPAATMGDVNNDGLKDLFIGGAKDHPGALLIQNKEGEYEKSYSKDFIEDKGSEDIDAIFFDMDSDGDLDLYIVSGGNEFQKDDPLLQDRLYENINGRFHKKKLPIFISSGSCVRPSDIDNDGDLDLFIGGRITPERYPEPPKSYILSNDGKGNFADASERVLSGDQSLGMVTDACWTDFNHDSYPELMIVGEWMPIKILNNERGILKDNTSQYLDSLSEGWWNTIVLGDIDLDGDEDFILGNMGLNQQYKATSEEPVEMYYGDFNNDGTVDPIMNYYIMGKSYPMALRDELLAQLPTFKSRFPDYNSYNNATIEDILSQNEFELAKKLKASKFTSSILINNDGHFELKPLPDEAQYSPVFAATFFDVNHDDLPDLVTGGNITAMPIRFGRVAANYGDVFLNQGNGKFDFMRSTDSGISVTGDVRKILIDNNSIIFIRNNDKPLIFKQMTRKN